MKAIVIRRDPFGIDEYDNIISIASPTTNTPISTSIVITNKVSDTVVSRTVSINDVILQIME